MLGAAYVLFHSVVIAKFPQKLYGCIQDGTSEISVSLHFGESKTNSQLCMAVLFLKKRFYVLTFKKCLKIVLVHVATKNYLGTLFRDSHRVRGHHQQRRQSGQALPLNNPRTTKHGFCHC